MDRYIDIDRERGRARYTDRHNARWNYIDARWNYIDGSIERWIDRTISMHRYGDRQVVIRMDRSIERWIARRIARKMDMPIARDKDEYD